VKQEGYPWVQVGPGPEPRISADFASRVIEHARRTRARKRRLKIGAGAVAGFAALFAMLLWMRAMPANQPTLTSDSRVAAPLATNDLNSVAWSDETYDPAAVLMPNARQAAKFDSYYATASWDTYASWDPYAYYASRNR
jgi:hypothetical protein